MGWTRGVRLAAWSLVLAFQGVAGGLEWTYADLTQPLPRHLPVSEVLMEEELVSASALHPRPLPAHLRSSGVRCANHVKYKWKVTHNALYSGPVQELGHTTLFSVALSKNEQTYFSQNAVVNMFMDGSLSSGILTGRAKQKNPRPINATAYFAMSSLHRGARKHPLPIILDFKDGRSQLIPFPPRGEDADRIGFRYRPPLLLHHDMDYDPFSRRMLVMTTHLVGVKDDLVAADDILIIDLSGKVLWRWDVLKHIPFQKELLKYTEDEITDLKQRFFNTKAIDWTHFNSIYWDFQNGEFFVNSRHLDTFWCVSDTTGEIVYAVGRLGTIKDLRNIDGTKASGLSLVWHAHALTKVGKDEFLIFDNNVHRRVPRDASLSPRQRKAMGPKLVRLKVDRAGGQCKITWEWNAPAAWDTQYHGDVDQVPGGNIFGTFPGVKRMIEITPQGRNMWESWGLDFTGGSQDFSKYGNEANRVMLWPLAMPLPPPPSAGGTKVVVSSIEKGGARRPITSSDPWDSPWLRVSHMSRLTEVVVSLPCEGRPGVPLNYNLTFVTYNTIAQRYRMTAKVHWYSRTDTRNARLLVKHRVELEPDWAASFSTVPLSSILPDKAGKAGPLTASLLIVVITDWGEIGSSLANVIVNCQKGEERTTGR